MDYYFRKDVPIYTQLSEIIIQDIVSGNLSPGDKLESVRELASKAKVNPNTVQRAYADLENKGLIITTRTLGSNVTLETTLIEKIRKHLIEEKIEVFLKEMAQLNVSKNEIIEKINETKGEKQ